MRKRTFIFLIALIVLCVSLLLLIGGRSGGAKSEAYDAAVKRGYSGTIEEWTLILG